ncbi:MAG: hypothetical protein K0V04_33230 [Deltaproteobacteria bacterium]|nr:hypothetical protein [Deltaproteobacteria bacterium]
MIPKNVVTTLVMPIVLACGCDGEPVDDQRQRQDADDSAAVRLPSRPLRLENPQDIERRAQLAIDRRIEARPADAAHRQELIDWKREQILLDDMAESMAMPAMFPSPMEVGR